MKSFAIVTIGCKANQFDSAGIREILKEHGYVEVPYDEKADVYIINTCTVTSRSDSDSRNYIRRAIRRNKEAIIIAAGCYPQTNAEELLSIEGIDYIIGNEEKADIIELIKEGKRERPRVLVSEPKATGFKRLKAYSFPGHTRAFLKIQDGCNYACSYCIVPKARGRSRSLDPDYVIEDIIRLKENGYKEVVLTGINLGTYGLDLTPRYTLSKLLRRIEDLKVVNRIRLSSIEPGEINEELREFLSSSRVVCNHLHIPMQSGDNKILRLMNRNYTAGFFKDLIEDLKKRIEGLCIGIDVIVGFPGEGEKEFENTYNFIKDLPIGYMHIFPYSPRKGTLSYGLPALDPKEVKRRVKLLRSLDEEKRRNFLKESLGKEALLLVEKKVNGMYKGLTRNYIRALVYSEADLTNLELPVYLKKIQNNYIIAEIEEWKG